MEMDMKAMVHIRDWHRAVNSLEEYYWGSRPKIIRMPGIVNTKCVRCSGVLNAHYIYDK